MAKQETDIDLDMNELCHWFPNKCNRIALACLFDDLAREACPLYQKYYKDYHGDK